MMCDVICEGFLTKSPPFNQPRSRWCKRYFVLGNEGLLYFKDAAKSSYKGEILLSEIITVREGSEHANKHSPKECNAEFAFELASEERTYVLITESSEMVKMWISCLNNVLCTKSSTDGSLQDVSPKSVKEKPKRKESVVQKIRKITTMSRPRTCPDIEDCSEHSGSSSSFQPDSKYRPDSSYSSQGGFEEEESMCIPTTSSISSFRSSDSAISSTSSARMRLTDNLPKSEPILDLEAQKLWILRNNKQSGLKIDTRGLPSERVLNPLRSPTLNERMVEVDGEATTLLSEANLNNLEELTPIGIQGAPDVFFNSPTNTQPRPRRVESFYDYPKNNVVEDIYDIPANLKLSHPEIQEPIYDDPKFDQRDGDIEGWYSCSKSFSRDVDGIYDSPKAISIQEDESIYDSPKSVLKTDEGFYDSPKAFSDDIYDSPKSFQEDVYDSPKSLKRENSLPLNRVISMSSDNSPHSSNASLPYSKHSSEDIYDVPKPKSLIDEFEKGERQNSISSAQSEKSLLEMIDESLFHTSTPSLATPPSASILVPTRNTPPSNNTPPRNDEEFEDIEGLYDTPSNMLKHRALSDTATMSTNNSQLEAMVLADDLFDTPSNLAAKASPHSSAESVQNDPMYDVPKVSPPSRPVPVPVSIPRGLPPPRLPPRTDDRSTTLLPKKPPPLPGRNTLPRGFVAPPQRAVPVPTTDLVELSRTGPIDNSSRTLTREKRAASHESPILRPTPPTPLNNYTDVSPSGPPPRPISHKPSVPSLPQRPERQMSNTNPFLPDFKNTDVPVSNPRASIPELSFTSKEVQDVFDKLEIDSPDVIPKPFKYAVEENIPPNTPISVFIPKYPVIQNLTVGQTSPKYPNMEKVKIGYQNVKDVKGALYRGGSNQGSRHKKLHKHTPTDDPAGYMAMKPPSERVTNPGPAISRPTRAPPIPVPAPEALPDRYEKMESPEKRLLGNPNYRATLQNHQNAVNRSPNNQNVFRYNGGNQTLPSRPIPPTPNDNYSNFSPNQQVVDLDYQTMDNPKSKSVEYLAMNLSDSLDFNFDTSAEYLQMNPNGPAEYLQMNPNGPAGYLQMNPNGPTGYLQMGGNDPTEFLNFEAPSLPPPAGEYLPMGTDPDPVEYLNFEGEGHRFNDIMFEDAHQSDF